MPAAIEIVPSEADILSRVIHPERANWSKEAAESILEFDFPPEDVARMNELATKARADSLSDSEAAELENYRRAGRSLELLQSRARLSLKRLSTGA